MSAYSVQGSKLWPSEALSLGLCNRPVELIVLLSEIIQFELPIATCLQSSPVRIAPPQRPGWRVAELSISKLGCRAFSPIHPTLYARTHYDPRRPNLSPFSKCSVCPKK
jgi:hypothetical protein